ncbi:MAG: hypothetical protein IT462_09600 [Planctomycetes bacterium]|nr:hypothetical protein [Planctomycetota bacterium]
MSNGLERAKLLAAKAPTSYADLKAAAEAKVVRWQWATFATYSYKPAHFEISKYARGRLLPSEPTPPVSGVHGYGFDANDRIVVERQQTEFPGRVYETFFVHEPDGIAACHYHHDPEKPWINAEWLVVGAKGVIECHTVYARGSSKSLTYTYDELGRMSRCQRRGSKSNGEIEVDDWWELEYDGTGQIVRVYWCYPDGRRILNFERPAKEATLRACRKKLLTQLTEAIVTTLRSKKIDDEVYAIVISHYDAQYEHRLPPDVSVGLVSECKRLQNLHGKRTPVFVWNPAEWPSGDLDLKLPTELATLCASVSQDIWQNELYEEVNQFLHDLARSVQKAKLPCRRAKNFVVVVVTLDLGDFANEVVAQVDGKTARALKQAGML